MCLNRGLNIRINQNHLHERVFRIVYQDQKFDFKTLLENGKSLTIHVNNLHYLVTEIYKVKNYISLDIMRDILTFQENGKYNIKSGIHLALRNMRTTLFGSETVSNLEAKKICFYGQISQIALDPCKFFKIK